MLIGFSMKNYSSYKDEANLSLLSSSKKEYERFNTFDINNIKLLKSALIYGPNGSGKTNLIDGLSFMRDMVLRSVMNGDLSSQCESFKFRINSKNNPSHFEIVFTEENTIYTYGFEILKGRVHKEWLYRKVKREVTVFERNAPEWESIKLCGEMKQAENIKRHTREDSLFITTADMLNIKLAGKIIKWFDKLSIIGSNFSTPGLTINYIEKDIDNKDKVLSYLKKADLRIEDFEFEVEDMDLEDGNELKEFLIKQKALDDNIKVNIKTRSVDIKTIHKVYDEHDEVADEIKLPLLRYQSSGTIKFFELIGPIIDVIDKGGVLVIDEIDSRLHCALVRFTLSLFNSIDKNPNNAQLICNTHDVLLLEEKIRRDQIWFVEKNEFSESELYSLEEFPNVRQDDLKLRKYLLGIYGAIPKLIGSGSYE